MSELILSLSQITLILQTVSKQELEVAFKWLDVVPMIEIGD